MFLNRAHQQLLLKKCTIQSHKLKVCEFLAFEPTVASLLFFIENSTFKEFHAGSSGMGVNCASIALQLSCSRFIKTLRKMKNLD